MIRPLRLSDIPAAMELKAAAGWNQTEADWENVLALDPNGCFVWDDGGRAVGSTTAVGFGDELAWTGMVLVHPEFRRRGIARALMEHALAWCDARGAASVKLDATAMGRPLYAALGFADEQPIERWVREGAPPESEAPSGAEPGDVLTPELLALDREAFGAGRERLLAVLARRWPGELRTSAAGYAMSRPGSEARFVGPCVAAGAAVARELLTNLVAARPGQRLYWDILPRQDKAVRLASDLGFRPARQLVRMARPLVPEAGDPARVWATAGFEYG